MSIFGPRAKPSVSRLGKRIKGWAIQGHVHIRWLCLTLIALSLWSTTAFAESLELRMLPMQHRLPQELLPSVEQLLNGEGTVSAVQHYLIVRATPQRLQEIEALIQTFDTPRRSFQITVDHSNRARSKWNEHEVNTQVDVQGGVKRTTRISGQLEATVNAREQMTQNHDRFFVQAVEGTRAFIRVGQSVAFSQHWLSLTQQYARVSSSLQFVEMDKGFAVQIRPIGDRVELELMPRFSALNRSGVIDFEELSTVIDVAPGEWVDVGGVMKQRDEVSRAIFSEFGARTENDQTLRVKVDALHRK